MAGRLDEVFENTGRANDSSRCRVGQGYLDDLDASEIRAWESSFREYMRSGHPGVGEAIRAENVISDDTETKLRDAIEAHKKLFRTAAAEETPTEAAG